MKKNMSRRSFLKKSAGALLSITGLGMGGHYYAHDIEPGWIDIKRITIKHKLIPEGFNGFKIVQFSDTHLGFQFQIKDLISVISKMEKLNPDVMIFSGDLMDQPDEYPMPDEIIPYLKKIKVPFGKYCIFGNHDHGGNGSEIYRNIMEKSDFKVLQNAHAKLSLMSGEAIYLAGIDDAMLGSPDFKSALSGIPDHVYTILLSHAPDLADTAVNYNVQLQLSGHSHGGQIQIPFAGALVTPPYAEKYREGTYDLQNMVLHVNRGLGTTRLPYRFLSRPEITLYELQKE